MNQRPTLDDLQTELDLDATPQWRDTFNRLTREADAKLSDSFDARLSDKLDQWEAAEANAQPQPLGKGSASAGRAQRTRRVPAWLSAAALIAIAVCLAVMLFGDRSPLSPTLAWADVVKAGRNVKQVHVTAFRYSSGDAASDKVTLVELFYQQPNHWRVHSSQSVEFFVAGKPVTFKQGMERLSDEMAQRHNFVSRGFVEQFETEGLPQAIMSVIFRGKVPPPEPVDTGMDEEGVVAFDYAHDPTRLWARVLVLKASGLPISMKIIEPASNTIAQVSFDYSDPQEASFFDVKAYEKQFRPDMSLPEMRQLGVAEVPGAKPINSAQAFESSGGYKAPPIRSVQIADDGQILLVTGVEENVTPSGRHIASDSFTSVTVDTWGNRYTAWRSHNMKEQRVIYTPVAPIQKADGPHRLHVKYELSEFHGGPVSVLLDEWVDLPQPQPVEDVLNEREQDAERRFQTLYSYYRSYGTLRQQINQLNEWLKYDPDSINAWMERIDLYTSRGMLDRAEAMWLDRGLELAMAYPYRAEEKLTLYLLKLAEAGDMDEVRRISTAIKSKVDKDRTSTSPGVRHQAIRFSEEDGTASFHGLDQAMNLPQIMAELPQRPLPGVTAVWRDREGYVLLRYDSPQNVVKARDYRWLLGREVLIPKGATHLRVHSPGGEYTQWRMVQLPEALHGAEELTVTVVEPLIVSRSRYHGRYTRDVSVALPAEVDTSIDRAWEHATAQRWNRSQVKQAPSQAEVVFGTMLGAQLDKNWQNVLDAVARLRELPHEAWVQQEGEAMGQILVPIADRMATAAEMEIKALTALGQLDEARSALKTYEQSRRNGTNLNTDPQALRQYTGIVFMWSMLIGKMIDADQRDQAAVLLNEIARRRPDLTGLRDYVNVEHNRGRIGISPRSEVRGVWSMLEGLQWRLAGYPDPWPEEDE